MVHEHLQLARVEGVAARAVHEEALDLEVRDPDAVDREGLTEGRLLGRGDGFGGLDRALGGREGEGGRGGRERGEEPRVEEEVFLHGSVGRGRARSAERTEVARG